MAAETFNADIPLFGKHQAFRRYGWVYLMFPGVLLGVGISLQLLRAWFPAVVVVLASALCFAATAGLLARALWGKLWQPVQLRLRFASGEVSLWTLAGQPLAQQPMASVRLEEVRVWASTYTDRSALSLTLGDRTLVVTASIAASGKAKHPTRAQTHSLTDGDWLKLREAFFPEQVDDLARMRQVLGSAQRVPRV